MKQNLKVWLLVCTGIEHGFSRLSMRLFPHYPFKRIRVTLDCYILRFNKLEPLKLLGRDTLLYKMFTRKKTLIRHHTHEIPSFSRMMFDHPLPELDLGHSGLDPFRGKEVVGVAFLGQATQVRSPFAGRHQSQSHVRARVDSEQSSWIGRVVFLAGAVGGESQPARGFWELDL